MVNLSRFKPFQLILNKAMGTRAVQLDQKESLKTNLTTDKVQDQCFESINSLIDTAIDNYKQPRVLLEALLEVKDAIKVYEGAELKDDLSRRQVIEHNKKIGCYAREIAGEAEEQIQEGAI